ncbi:hypothetical protein DXG03_006500 [Asterophora parasitica]|uniref:Meiotically up-regulated protein Msb1/Mug8 domain-containing protein n=1 Tax=Asterophora parasitica TaxID=117018 RepID=A0A9P7KB44_9AGAR|nr:hypothetical protein DXG03_006500 [Asterophora parasitica]
MPSIFSRSRTTSTTRKDAKLAANLAASLTANLTANLTASLDEFGRVSTPGPDVPPPVPDGSFLPLTLDRPRPHADSAPAPDYGYLSHERHVVLGLDHAARLVTVLADELQSRGGITTPFIFSSSALDISAPAIKRLVRTFLDTCAHPTDRTSESKWRDEARFAGHHELGMCLRWALARVIRSVGGHDVRGLISWDRYVEFRDSEAALGYPPAHFPSLLSPLPAPLPSLLLTLLTLLSRLTANSTSSGHTPPTLSPLFGPLIFGLGPPSLAFHHTYMHYLRAVNAMEHLQLAFIRYQDASSMGVPTRLKEWIKGYPAMLPFLQEPTSQANKPQARRGVRTTRVMSVRRNVRMYSPDLVSTAASWAKGSNALAVSKEWARISPPTLKLPPRYSDAFKKRMDLPPQFHPDAGVAPPATRSQTLGDTDRFRSLTDLKWGEFESMGFSEHGEKQLQFDLTESARNERVQKRSTLSWTDFSSAGFTRSDAPLSTTLQFSSPVASTISSWPAHSADIQKKLKKTERKLPPFGWDTEPVVGSEEVVEDAFVDVFCDLVWGGGWMDLEREELVARDCNWALVEFKSLPPNRTTTSGTSDPRTASTLILFEEFVPLEYRQQLAQSTSTSSSRRRLPSLFSTSSKPKQWKPAPTLNGRPYVVGHVPRSPNYREMEFEGLLKGSTATKVISLGAKPTASTSTSTSTKSPSTPSRSTSAISAPLYVPAADVTLTPGPKSEEVHSDYSTGTTKSMTPSQVSAKRSSRFRLPGGIPVPSPGGSRKSGMVPAEYSTVDFETRLASYSDDEWEGLDGAKKKRGYEEESVKQKRRQSKDDAWVDILVGTQGRRIGGQDAQLRGGRGLASRRSDPDMASAEVAQVLAGIRDRTPSLVSSVHPHVPRLDRDREHREHDRVDRDPGGGLDALHDLDVDEIETVPRTSNATSSVYTNDVSYDHEEEEQKKKYQDLDPDDNEDPPAAVLTARQIARNQRRLGYFDLHPERRPLSLIQSQSQSEDESRVARLAYDADSGGEESDDGPASDVSHQPAIAAAGVPQPLRKLPAPPPEPIITPPTPTLPTTQFEPAPASNGNGTHAAPSPSPSPPSPAPTPSSKTAALIEMFKERERGSSPKLGAAAPSPVTPSRLPIRTASLPLAKDAPASPVSTPSPSPIAAPTPRVAVALPDPPLIEPPRVPLEETGRASPARYVHGAPLHNVLEEEEEET